MFWQKYLQKIQAALWRTYRYWLIGGLVVIACGIFFYRLLFHQSGQQTLTEQPVPRFSAQAISGDHVKHEQNQKESSQMAPKPVVIDLKGAVHQPGVLELPAGSRLQDAINQAGGLTSGADGRLINLAQPLIDGQAVYIPALGDPGPPALTSVLNGNAIGQNSGQVLINLNTGTVQDLEGLVGIGPKKAAEIVAFREKNHPFHAVEDLKEVGGIGPKRFEQIKEQVTV